MKETAVTVQWTRKRQFVGTDSGKHSVVISSHSEDNHTGVKPSELLLLALGSCSAYDLVSILEKKRYKLNGLDVRVEAAQQEEPPYTFRRIHMAFTIQGRDIKEKDAQQAAELSIDKYCSVAATIRGEAEVTYAIEVVPSDS